MPSGAERFGHKTFFLAPPWPEAGSCTALAPDECRHAVKSMRVKRGESIRVVDGLGHAAESQVINADQGCLEIRLGEVARAPADRAPAGRIGLPWIRTPSRIDWVVEKVTELGASAIDIFIADKSVRSTPKGKSAKRERWQRLAKAAMKQSGRAWLPEIQIHDSLSAFLDTRPKARLYVAGPDGLTPSQIDFGGEAPERILLVGAEGGWSEREEALINERDAQLISLGPRRLRVETAAVVLCALMSLEVRGA